MVPQMPPTAIKQRNGLISPIEVSENTDFSGTSIQVDRKERKQINELSPHVHLSVKFQTRGIFAVEHARPRRHMYDG
jgi:hypothetical protein